MRPDDLAALIETERRVLADDLGPPEVLEKRILRALRNVPPGGGSAGGPSKATLAGGSALLAAVVATIGLLQGAGREPPPREEPVSESDAGLDSPAPHEISPAGREEKPAARPSVPPVARRAAPPTGVARQPPINAGRLPGDTTSAEPVAAHAEIDAYDHAQALLGAGKHDEAAAAFTAVLGAFPSGALRNEAQLSQLESLYRAGRYDEAARSAEMTLASGHMSRRGDVARLRGDALVKLGRCDLAAQAFDAALHLGARALTLARVDNALSACVR